MVVAVGGWLTPSLSPIAGLLGLKVLQTFPFYWQAAASLLLNPEMSPGTWAEDKSREHPCAFLKTPQVSPLCPSPSLSQATLHYSCLLSERSCYLLEEPHLGQVFSASEFRGSMIIKSFDSERLSTGIELLYFHCNAGRYQREDLYAHFINEELWGLGWEAVCLKTPSRARFGKKNMGVCAQDSPHHCQEGYGSPSLTFRIWRL